jgi:short subunit dehydrogenase-like uncharacterized protein
MDGTKIPEKDFDIVLYGSTGFVGSRAAEYLAKHPQQEQLCWAIAGLDRNKLEQVKQRLGATAASVTVLVADSRDRDAVDAVVSRTRVLLNTAGPFALYGSSVVDACVRLQTDYVDTTGENSWRTRCTLPGLRLPPMETAVGRSTISVVGQPCASI